MPKKKPLPPKTVTIVRHLTVEEKTCPQCGKHFAGVKKRVFCSRACQAQHDYQKHAEEYRQKRRDAYARQNS